MMGESDVSSTAPLPTSPSSSSLPKASLLLSLPPDLLPLLRFHLPYPDLLALRHTHPYFYHSPLLSTNTNIRLKVAWLVDRKERGLSCPTHSSTLFKTDREFCASREVKRIMKLRRRHGDCREGPGGCEVVRGGSCGGKVRGREAWAWEWVWSLLIIGTALLVWRWGHNDTPGSSLTIYQGMANHSTSAKVTASQT